MTVSTVQIVVCKQHSNCVEHTKMEYASLSWENYSPIRGNSLAGLTLCNKCALKEFSRFTMYFLIVGGDGWDSKVVYHLTGETFINFVYLRCYGIFLLFSVVTLRRFSHTFNDFFCSYLFFLFTRCYHNGRNTYWHCYCHPLFHFIPLTQY